MTRCIVLMFALLVLTSGFFLGPEPVLAGTPIPEEPIAAPTPESQPTATPRRSPTIIRYALDPSEALMDLVLRLVREMMEDITRTLGRATSQMTTQFMRWLQGKQGPYERAGRLLLSVSQALFIPMAVLRLVWYHKNKIVDDDALAAVLVEWVAIGLLVASFPRIMDWTGAFSRRLALILLAEGGREALESWPSFLSFLPSLGLGGLFLSFLSQFIAFLVVLGLFMAFFALHAASFVFATLTPFLLSLSMLPPFRFLRRLLALGYVVFLVAPAIMALALLALAWVPLGGGKFDIPLIGPLIRLGWAAAAAGLLFKLAGLLGSAGLDAFREAAGAFVGAVKATVAGLTGAGLVAASVATGGVGALAAGGAAAAGQAAASGAMAATEGGASAAVAGGVDALARAETLARMAHVVGGPGSLSGRMGAALAGYYRTLRRERMAAEESNTIAGEEAARPRSHQTAYAVAQALDPDFPQSYRTYIRTLDRVQEALKDVRDEQGLPVMPHLWSQQNDPERAALAGALVAMYWRESENFEKVLKEKGWPALRRKAEERLKSLEERDDAG